MTGGASDSERQGKGAGKGVPPAACACACIPHEFAERTIIYRRKKKEKKRITTFLESAVCIISNVIQHLSSKSGPQSSSCALGIINCSCRPQPWPVGHLLQPSTNDERDAYPTDALPRLASSRAVKQATFSKASFYISQFMLHLVHRFAELDMSFMPTLPKLHAVRTLIRPIILEQGCESRTLGLHHPCF